MALAASDFNATSNNYTNIKVTVVPGKLEITPITDEYEITVTGNNATRVYNGSEQSVNGYTVSAYDDTITLTGPAQNADVATAKGTNVGEYTMALAVSDFTATSDNYTNIKVTVVPGKLEITPITDEYVITVTGNDATRVYNGSEQSVNGYTVSAYDDTITLTGPAQDAEVATAKGTNVGEYTMTLAASDFIATSDNYTNIKVTVVPGVLKITPITEEYVITVTGNNATRVYNGSEQAVNGYTVSAYDNTITLTGPAQDAEVATAKGTNVGEYTMALAASDFNATSENYTNIKVTVVPGVLKITPITDEYEITVTGNNATRVYDGSEQSVNGYTVSVYDNTITLTGPAQNADVATAKGTNVGEYTMALAASDFTATSDNYTNIKVTVVPGVLKITPITDEYVITMTGNNATKVYTGSEQSVNGYTVSAYDGTITLTGPDQDDAKATAKGTNVGEYTMALAASDFTATSENYTNIKVTVVPGVLKITPITDEYVITVTGNSATRVYNGSEQSVNGYTVSAYDDTITLTGPAQDAEVATAKGTNVGQYTMALAASDFTATSENYTNIKVTVVPGKLEITPITDEYVITVTGNSATKVYNGSEQSVNGYTVSEHDDTITLTGPDQDADVATAKGTNVGEYTMALASEDFTATSANYANIKITVMPGRLRITPIAEEKETAPTGIEVGGACNCGECFE
ncbi:MAG: MBG domain-containing protein [Bacillota bacterium]|nr:MBG domain-containing protein [Bacillota bacterium]